MLIATLAAAAIAALTLIHTPKNPPPDAPENAVYYVHVDDVTPCVFGYMLKQGWYGPAEDTLQATGQQVLEAQRHCGMDLLPQA